MVGAGQNIDSMGVAGKILRNKELEGRISSCVAEAELVPDWWEFGRTLPLSASQILSQGRSSQLVGLFLWRAVGNGKRLWDSESHRQRTKGEPPDGGDSLIGPLVEQWYAE